MRLEIERAERRKESAEQDIRIWRRMYLEAMKSLVMEERANRLEADRKLVEAQKELAEAKKAIDPKLKSLLEVLKNFN